MADLQNCDLAPEWKQSEWATEDSGERDPSFFDGADAHGHLSNSQLAGIAPGKVSASMMYATARFNAYVSWIGFESGADMAEQRDETVRYFVEQY